MSTGSTVRGQKENKKLKKKKRGGGGGGRGFEGGPQSRNCSENGGGKKQAKRGVEQIDWRILPQCGLNAVGVRGGGEKRVKEKNQTEGIREKKKVGGAASRSKLALRFTEPGLLMQTGCAHVH